MLTTDILVALEDNGIEVIEQSSFYKATRNGRSLYVAKSKGSVCTRIDVSGFSFEHPAAAPPKKKNGKVTAVIDGRHEKADEALALAIALLRDAVEETAQVEEPVPLVELVVDPALDEDLTSDEEFLG